MRLIITLLIFLSSFVSISQDTTSVDTDSTKIEYPAWHVVGGDTVGIIFTIEQARKIDNDAELLRELQILVNKMDGADSINIEIINKLQQKVANLELQIETIRSKSTDKDEIIANLNEQISKFEDNEANYEEELANKDEIIKLKDDEIKKHKFQKVVAYIVGGAALFFSVLLLAAG